MRGFSLLPRLLFFLAASSSSFAARHAFSLSSRSLRHGVKARAGEARNNSLNVANRRAYKTPDPNCKTGVISMSGAGPDPQVCCAGYCGECSDYPTCETVREQDSKNACCATAVAELACDKGAPANVCLKKCSESLPPCILEAGEAFEMPATTSAANDCNEAVPEWMQKAEAAVKAVEGGEEQWEEYQKNALLFLKKESGKITDALLKAGFSKEQAATYLHYKRTGAMPGCPAKLE